MDEKELAAFAAVVGWKPIPLPTVFCQRWLAGKLSRTEEKIMVRKIKRDAELVQRLEILAEIDGCSLSDKTRATVARLKKAALEESDPDALLRLERVIAVFS